MSTPYGLGLGFNCAQGSPSHSRYFKLLCVIVLIVSFFNVQLYFSQFYRDQLPKTTTRQSRITSGVNDYLVHTSNCKILNLNPFDKSAVQYIERGKEVLCDRTTLVLVGQTLKLNSTWLSKEKSERPKCCYRSIKRLTQDSKLYKWDADYGIKISETCNEVSTSSAGTVIQDPFVQTECQVRWKNPHSKNKNINSTTATTMEDELTFHTTTIKNFYATVLHPQDHSNTTREKFYFWNNFSSRVNNTSEKEKEGHIPNSKQLPPNVLILGFDSVSRLQMIRNMQETREFLFDNDFIELKGYTKVGDNTFPNMMAAMGGMETNNYPCFPNRSTKLDDCPFIWKNFSRNNYLTSFAEDSAGLAVFNYFKVGFVEQPMDYYLRPFTTAYYKYHGVGRGSNYYGCVSGGSLTNHLLQYAQDFLKAVNGNTPYFYYSWLSYAAYHNFNGLRVIDTRFKNFVKHVLRGGRQHNEKAGKNNAREDSEDRTIIFLISDHGLRYHPFRSQFLGYFEASLPYFFVRLPPYIKKSHPHWYENLKINSDRLTTPLDFHATLEDILSLSQQLQMSSESGGNWSTNFNFNSQPEKFQFTHSNWEKRYRPVYSFFEETPENRSCESSLIPEKFCRCGVEMKANIYTGMGKKFALAVIKKVNELLGPLIIKQPGSKSSQCVPLVYHDILYNRAVASGLINIKIDHSENNFHFIQLKGKLGSVEKYPIELKGNYTDFLIGVDVKPSLALFEAKIRLIEGYNVNSNNNDNNMYKMFEIIGDVNRLNSYQGQSDCVSDVQLKMFCYCANLRSTSKA